LHPSELELCAVLKARLCASVFQLSTCISRECAKSNVCFCHKYMAEDVLNGVVQVGRHAEFREAINVSQLGHGHLIVGVVPINTTSPAFERGSVLSRISWP